MKKARNLVTILFLSLIVGGMTSCEISRHTDNGRHRGWFHKHEYPKRNKGAVLIINPDNQNNRDRHEEH
jgi:hypothetical protein